MNTTGWRAKIELYKNEQIGENGGQLASQNGQIHLEQSVRAHRPLVLHPLDHQEVGQLSLPVTFLARIPVS